MNDRSFRGAIPALLLCWFAAIPALSESFSGLVVGISDGDSIKVLRDGKEVRVRLQGIDAPEKGQAYANVARDGLSHAIFKKTIRVEIVDHDRYGRIVGHIYLEETYINLELVKAGLAWHYTRHSDDEALAQAQKDARKAKRGLWAGARQIPPWEFRRAKREQRGS